MPLLADIARLTLEQGNARAQGVLNSGAAWANAAQNVGQIVGAIPAQIQQQKIQAQESAMRAQEMQIRQSQVAAAQRHQQGQQVLAEAIKQFTTDKGEPDYQKIATVVGQAGFPELGNEYLKASTENAQHVETLADLKRKQTQAQRALIGDAAYEAKTPEGFTARIAYLQSQDALTPDFVESLKAATNPLTDWEAIREKYLPDSPKWQELNKPTKIERGAVVTNLATGAVLGKGEPQQPTPASIAMDAAKGDTTAQQAMGLMRPPKEDKSPSVGSFEDYVTKKYGANPTPAQIVQAHRELDKPPTVNVSVADRNDVKDTVAGMKDGTLPPLLPGRASKEYVALMAEAKRQGFDLATAATDWMATQKHISTLNGTQQTRLNQAINQLPELLDSIDTLASKWKGGRFPTLNKGNLIAAKNGIYGEEVASVARQLEAQIADVTGDLGAVYMGGNSPTDHALKLAEKALSSDWSEKVLKDMVALAKQNVQTRRNSIKNTGVQGASPNNQYAPQPEVASPKIERWELDPKTNAYKKVGG